MAGYKSLLGSMQKIGILRQPKAIGSATEWLAGGISDDQWLDSAGSADAYKNLWYDKDTSVPDADIKVEDIDYNSQDGNMKETTRSYIETTSVFPKINFSSMAFLETLPLHLVAAFQKVSEGAASPFLKTIDPANDPTLDFRNNEGYLYTIAMMLNRSSEVIGYGSILKNALLNDFSFEIDNQADGIARFGKISGTWIGTQLVNNQVLASSWYDDSAPTSPIIGHDTTNNDWRLNLTINDSYSAHCWNKFKLTLNNNIEARCRGTNGIAANWDLVAPSLAIELDIPMTGNNYSIFKEYADGTNASIVFGNRGIDVGTSNPLVAGDFEITASKNEITATPFTYDNGYQVLKLQMSVLYDATNNRWGDGINAQLIQIADGNDQAL